MHIKNAEYTHLTIKVGDKHINLPPRGVAEINKKDLPDCKKLLDQGAIFVLAPEKKSSSGSGSKSSKSKPKPASGEKSKSEAKK